MSSLLPETCSSVQVHSKSAHQLHCSIHDPPQARPSKRSRPSLMLVLSPHALWGAYTSALRFLLQGWHSVTALPLVCCCFRTAYHSCKRCHTAQRCGGSGWSLNALDSLCPLARYCHPPPQLHSKRQRIYTLFLYLLCALGIVLCSATKTFSFWTEANRSEKKNIKWVADQST